MTSSINPFTEAVAEYTDQRLINIVKSPNEYSPKLAQASITEAKKRGLYPLKEEAPKPQGSPDYLTIIRNKITRGESIEECEQYLLNAGVAQEEALSILDKAARTAALKEKRKAENDNSGPSVWSILFIIFIVVRIIMRMMRD